MWMLVAREPRPDALVWPGRHGLAALDAVVWPLLFVLAVHRLPAPAGLVVPFTAAVAVLCAAVRLRRALWCNHRYRFTTWRWGGIAFGVLVFGLALQLFLAASMWS